ncbi:hypothetical protein E2C01_009348 [Portunus trituberculatus]|uniref:Uncharacterized protein n=1 Tax=Portunus trituberculatus TaxID=210409 RepID=A0A5B7D4V1_PORTR|nr:hypothetical protein [Portunus trituberculatus]
MLNKILSMLPVGARQVQQLQLWVPSAIGFGAAAAGVGLYFTEWKLINQYIPFYGGRYKEQEQEDCDRESGVLSCSASPWSSCASSASSTLPSVTSSSSSSSPALRSVVARPSWGAVGSQRDRFNSSPSDAWQMRPVVLHTLRLGTTRLLPLMMLPLLDQGQPLYL